VRYWPTKAVVEVRDQGLDWGPFLNKLGDLIIVASEWTRLSGTAVVASGSIDPEGRKTMTRISGGTAGANTVLRNTVTLSDDSVFTEDVFQRVRA
jgi:hypothetical protein